MSLLYLLRGLDRRRYEPAILFNAPPGGVDEPFAQLGIPIHHDTSIGIYPHAQGARLSVRSLRPWEVLTRPAGIVPSARRFEQFLRLYPQDLVHLNSSVQIPAGLGARRAGVPVVWHIREEMYPGTVGIRRAAVRRCIDRCAAGIVAISQRNADVLGLPEKTEVIHNFVDFEHFDRGLDRREARRSLGLPADRPIVLMLGGIVPHKGAEVLVEAAASVRAARPECLFVVAGIAPTGEESPSAVKRALRRALEGIGFVRDVQREVLGLMRRHRLQDTVRFIGMQSDVPRLLASSDLVAWPATVPHFSRPIIEAGAMGLPVVASDYAATRELVIPGRTGLLVEPRRPAELAAAILEVLSDRVKAAGMGQEGYALARERYDARKNAARTFAVYERVLSQARPAGKGEAA